MTAMRHLFVGTLLVAAAVGSAAAEPAETIETIVVTAKPVRVSLPAIPKVLPASTVEVAAPMPTDMPEAEIDYHMLRIAVSPEESAAEHVRT